jgi:hypothetical protein
LCLLNREQCYPNGSGTYLSTCLVYLSTFRYSYQPKSPPCLRKEAHLSIVAAVLEIPLVLVLLHDILLTENIFTCQSFVRRPGAHGSRVKVTAIGRDIYTEGQKRERCLTCQHHAPFVVLRHSPQSALRRTVPHATRIITSAPSTSCHYFLPVSHLGTQPPYSIALHSKLSLTLLTLLNVQ